MHPALHKTLIEIRYAFARPGTICEIFAYSGILVMSRSHVYVNLSLDPSGIFIEIGLIAGCRLFTGVPGRTKCPVAPASVIASLFLSSLEKCSILYPVL